MPDRLPTRDEQDWLPTDLDLDRRRWTTALYYLHETNPDNGLVRDKIDLAAPCSIAAVGMALATLPMESATITRSQDADARTTHHDSTRSPCPETIAMALEVTVGPPALTINNGYTFLVSELDQGNRI